MISAKDVAALRERTGRRHDGLQEGARARPSGDIDKAIELLRSKGAAKAEKRAGASDERRHDRHVHPPQRQGRRAGGDQLRDRLRRAHGRLPALGNWSRSTSPPRAPIAVDKDQVPPEQVESERRSSSSRSRRGQAGAHDRQDRRGQGRRRTTRTSRSCTSLGARAKKTIGELVKEVSAKTGENIRSAASCAIQMGECSVATAELAP